MKIETNNSTVKNLQRFATGGEAEWVELENSRVVTEFFDALPWKNNRIDFQVLERDVTSIDLWSCTETESAGFVRMTTLASYMHAAVCVFDEHPVLVMPIRLVEQKILNLLSAGGDAMFFVWDEHQGLRLEDFIAVTDWKATGFRRKKMEVTY